MEKVWPLTAEFTLAIAFLLFFGKYNLLVMAESTPPKEQENELLESIDALHKEGRFDEVYILLSGAYQEGYSKSGEILWRYARACFDKQEIITDKSEKETLIREGLKVAKEAVEVSPDHYAGYKWKAILLGELGYLTPLTEKISNSFVIRQDLEKSLRLRPNDSVTLYVLGKWCQSVASVNWISRKIASTLFATPPHSTYEEALDFYKRSYDLNPFKRCAFDIGECYHGMKQKEKCCEWMQKCLDCVNSGADGAPTKLEEELMSKAKTFL